MARVLTQHRNVEANYTCAKETFKEIVLKTLKMREMELHHIYKLCANTIDPKHHFFKGPGDWSCFTIIVQQRRDDPRTTKNILHVAKHNERGNTSLRRFNCFNPTSALYLHVRLEINCEHPLQKEQSMKSYNISISHRIAGRAGYQSSSSARCVKKPIVVGPFGSGTLNKNTGHSFKFCVSAGLKAACGKQFVTVMFSHSIGIRH
ncbi:hypothetical protein HELRODRAFT_171792 [Helobdella robusta]|uniref:Uncharacterized protein n=1 Tax=Helobdella robusta TaxID=6412 RepID=T1F4P2_HELRO|nr:hypothetical protein HELRODRAFT_171792 [Helobdella robusta]ESO05397.1 hypothetical protein HELRODRAFT_171792 [Helobdella robusta]